MGEKAFTKVQYGKETTHNTAVAATARWPGVVKIGADRKPIFPEEATGLRAKSQRSQVNQIFAGGITFSSDDALFQKLPMLFSIGVKGGVTAAEVTSSQGDYLWDFSHSLSATNAPDSITLEYGDDTQAYEIEGVFLQRITLSGKMGAAESVKIEASGFGKQITPTTYTASINLLAADAEPMIANLAKIYVDPTWATLGSTQKTALLREFKIEILTGLHPKFYGDGTKMISDFGQGYLDCLASFTFERSSAEDTLIFDSFQAETKKAIRFMVEGTQIGTGAKHSITIDMFGTFEEVIPIGTDVEGNNLDTAIFHTHSDGLASPHHFAVKVVTNKNTM
jgi:hypothetical protein